MADDMKSKSEEFWKEKLSPEQYKVLRKKGTETPFSGKYDQHFESGFYKCGACGEKLFKSDTKYDAHCGWPSFYDVIDTDKVELLSDNSHGMNRTEVVCKNCGSHLGHVFDVTNTDTGKWYCINSISLDFEEKK